MTKQDVISNNRLIATFMGAEHYPPNDYKIQTEFGVQMWNVEKLHYSTDWSWLMAVINKCEALSICLDDEDGDFFPEFLIRPKYTSIDLMFMEDTEFEWKLRRGTTKIEGAYLAVADFIKWYNEQSK